MANNKPSIVILCPYPNNTAPSQRFRFEQQIPLLNQHFKIRQCAFWSEKSNQILYSQGKLFQKSIGLLLGIVSRLTHLVHCMSADIIFVHREIVPIGSTLFERFLSKTFDKKIIFDFDDAIWNLDTSDENKGLEWLKSSTKVGKIIGLSSTIITGNSYLSRYAKQFNSSISIIPTTIDTSYHIPISKANSNRPICIGWTGSKTTVKHFEMIVPILREIKNKYKSQIYFKLIGDENYTNSALELLGTKWALKSEIEDLQEIDIGIMPLPDDEWSKGKCGFKGLQYMALEIPTIMSPVEVNIEIVNHNINGFLAHSDNDWIDHLSALIENKELRNRIGKEGRKTVISKFSVESQKENYLSIFNNLIR